MTRHNYAVLTDLETIGVEAHDIQNCRGNLWRQVGL